jgi:hypothetical protein
MALRKEFKDKDKMKEFQEKGISFELQYWPRVQ